MAVTNEQRKAVYKYYRSAGYSVKEARALRNRPLKVFDDYEDYKAVAPEDRKIRMPKVPASKRSIKQAKTRLKKLGVNARTIHNITRKKNEVLRTTLQLERYFKTVKKEMVGPGAKKRWKDVKFDLQAAMKKQDFWDYMSDAYDFIVGVSL